MAEQQAETYIIFDIIDSISQRFPKSSSARIYRMNLTIPQSSLTVRSNYTVVITTISSCEGKSVTGCIMISITSPPTEIFTGF
jgi:hypothetical protein